MPLPQGVTATTLTVKATKTTRSSPITISAGIAPSVDLTHAASGVKLSAMIETLVSEPGLASKILVPHSSQAGFVDDAGTAVTRWHYVATTTSRTASGTLASAPRTKRFLLPVGTTAVELETLPVHTPLPADEPDIPESLLPPRLSPAALSATYGVHLGAATADDTARINAAIAALPNGKVIGMPGQTYLISAPIIAKSGTTIDMTGATVRLKAGSNCNMIANEALTTARTLMDAVTTASSTTLTSATAAFTAGDVGKALMVWGAGTDGQALKTTVASVTNATTVVMANAAAVTRTWANATVGTRDKDITIIGGTWDRLSNQHTSGVAGSGNNFRFRRADGVHVVGVNPKSNYVAGGLKYAINFGDCTDFLVERIRFDYSSDGVHLNGPIKGGTIRNLRGWTRDDTVSLTPNDWVGNDDVYGDITDVLIEDIKPWKSDNTVVKILGGSDTPVQTASRRIRVRNIGGYASNIDQPHMPGIVYIGNDPAMANTAGGLLEDITLENIDGKVPNSSPLIGIKAPALDGLRISGISYSNASGTQSAIWLSPAVAANWGSVVLENLRFAAVPGTLSPIYVASGLTIKSLTVDKVDVLSWPNSTDTSAVLTIGGSVNVLRVSRVNSTANVGGVVVRLTTSGAAGVVGELFMDTVNHSNVSGNGYALSVAANMTITKAVLSNIAGNCGAYCVFLANTTAVISYLSLRDVHWNNGGGFISSSAAGVSSLPFVQISNSTSATTWGIGDVATNTMFQLSNMTATPSVHIFNLRATAVVKVNAQNCDFNGKNVQGNAGYTIASKAFGLPIDISLLNSKTKGDAAYNTNAALACGIGQVVYTGTAWKSLIDGTTY